MRNFQSQSSGSASNKPHKVDSEIDLITNSISIQSRLHHQTDNKYLNLRRLNSNRIEKLNSLISELEPNERRSSSDGKSSVQPIQSDLISSTNANFYNSSTNSAYSSTDFLSHVENRHENTDLLTLFNLVRSENLANVQVSRFSGKHSNTNKKLEDLIKVEQIDESKLDPNKSIIEQLLGNGDDSKNMDDSSAFSRIEFNLKFLKGEENAKSVRTRQVKPEMKLKRLRSKKPIEVTEKREYSILEYLTRLGASVAPLDAFQHAQLAMRHGKRSPYQPQIESFNFKSINFCKLEFIYDESFYWIVKVKRILIAKDNSVLYQMKFVKNVNSLSAGSLNSSVINNNAVINNLLFLFMADATKKSSCILSRIKRLDL
jgi:hypothetical protein